MCRFLVHLTALLAIAPVEGFAPVQRLPALNSRLYVSTSDSSGAKSDAPAKASASAFEDIKSKALVAMNQETADQILGNVLSGEFGKRGEVYVATQVFLVLCILFGGLPIFGDFLNLLCGPVLMAIGVGVCALGFIDMGASLSPWPVPTGDDLVTDGIYSKVRHPIYSGLLAIMAGFSVATGSAPRLLLTTALFYALDVKSDYEEKELAKEFSEYEAYKDAVPGKFFPNELVVLLPWTESEDKDGSFE